MELNDDYLLAYRNLQSVCNSLFERWHFRMLNDSYRNQAYKEAIMKKIRQGFTSVLDIGAGTGILSLFAVTSGARDVHACDYSPIMCHIAQKVLKANKADKKVTLINKLSNNLTIPEDLQSRKSLVVTETMDSGLLGEHLLQTLAHAWDKLLKPACPQLVANLECRAPMTNHGVVIPLGARLWAVPIRCPTIARRSYITSDTYQSPWSFGYIQFFSDNNEPYDTENLRVLKDCTFLSEPVEVFTFDFNDPLQLNAYLNGEKDGKHLSFQFKGKSDALAVWFDVFLDEDIKISSSPFSEEENCCWDQAIFKFKEPKPNSLDIKVNCGGGKLSIIVVGSPTISPPDQVRTKQIPVKVDLISFLNNKRFQENLFKLPENFGTVKNVLDLSPFPTLGIRFLQLNDANVTCKVSLENAQLTISEFLSSNHLNADKVKCIEEIDISGLCSSAKFDLIVLDLFDSSGDLKYGCINMVPELKELLSPGGSFVPASVTAMCQLIDCEWISRTSRVIDEDLTQTFKVAEFINTYQVPQQLDVDLRNTRYTALSEAVECLQLRVTELDRDTRVRESLPVTVTGEGNVTGVSLWYHYQLTPGEQPLSSLSEHSHVNQVVYTVDPPLAVKTGETISVNISYHRGIVRIKVGN